MSDQPPPDAPRPNPPEEGEQPPPPEQPEPSPPRKSVDLHETPSGLRPAAWKDLPPPEIIREKPKREKPDAAKKAKEALQSKGARQIAMGIGAVVILIGLVLLLMPRTTDRTALGAAKIFAGALEDGDAETMRSVSTGIAPSLVDGLMITIDRMVQDGLASPFEDANPTVPPPAPNADVAVGTIMCEGVNGDDFLRIDMELVKTEEGAWRVSQFASTSLRD